MDPPNRVLVVGYANKSNLYSRNWEKSLQKCQFNYQLIGEGEKWLGLATRIKSYLKFLTSEPINHQTVYALIDVYDIITIGDEQEFLEKWKRHLRPIVIGAEPNCNPSLCRPLENYWHHFPEEYDTTTNRYLNFGMVAGLQQHLIEFLSWLITDSKDYHPELWNEQIAASRYIDSHPGLVSLDNRMDLVGNVICHPIHSNIHQFSWTNSVSDGHQVFFGDGRVLYRYKIQDYVAESYPIFVHTPSKAIDALQRYQKYGRLILKDEWSSPTMDMILIPGYHWIWLAILIVIIILWLIFGSQEWIVAGFVLAFAILIIYLLSL